MSGCVQMSSEDFLKALNILQSCRLWLCCWVVIFSKCWQNGHQRGSTSSSHNWKVNNGLTEHQAFFYLKQIIEGVLSDLNVTQDEKSEHCSNQIYLDIAFFSDFWKDKDNVILIPVVSMRYAWQPIQKMQSILSDFLLEREGSS